MNKSITIVDCSFIQIMNSSGYIVKIRENNISIYMTSIIFISYSSKKELFV